MTPQEFEQLTIEIERERFRAGTANPIHFGIQLGHREKQRLQKLIELGKDVRSKTVRAKVERWKRQVQRLQASIDRLQKLKSDIQKSRLRIATPAQSNRPDFAYRRIRVE